ncbi:hypothetical protein NDN08_001694 [Rhodosorus marinus]|uniref:J domain-containing protein n=1 Tax=Rhodosorus marinus TaxID=101924 RepID=A0AAV8URI6_9RHOD|nr:hypothetical protein NDN08_001694 [Rhodosorus marinus]
MLRTVFVIRRFRERCRRNLWTDPYLFLGVEKGVERNELRRRYLELARVEHPDVNAGSNEAHERFIALSNALKVVEKELKDAQGLPGLFSHAAPVDVFKHVSEALKPEVKKVAEEIEASGPDWGGMWQMVELMKATEAAERPRTPKMIQNASEKATDS